MKLAWYGNFVCSRMMLGGYSEPQPATQEVHDALELIQDDLEQREGKKFTTFKALSFISQVVAGTNFVIKVSPHRLTSMMCKCLDQNQSSNWIKIGFQLLSSR